MRLLYSATSPYARKVRAVAIEKALDLQVAPEPVDPFGDAGELHRLSPLGKVPALILNDGRAILDSRVICEFLDGIGHGPRLIPEPLQARIDTLTRQAMADGLMDAALALVMERRRKPEQRSAEWMERWTSALDRTIAAFDRDTRDPAAIDLGDLALAAALGYLDFRLPDLAWGNTSPRLSAWHKAVSMRPCLARTAPSAT